MQKYAPFKANMLSFSAPKTCDIRSSESNALPDKRNGKCDRAVLPPQFTETRRLTRSQSFDLIPNTSYGDSRLMTANVRIGTSECGRIFTPLQQLQLKKRPNRAVRTQMMLNVKIRTLVYRMIQVVIWGC